FSRAILTTGEPHAPGGRQATRLRAERSSPRRGLPRPPVSGTVLTMNGQQIGSVIGAVFGVIYVWVNASPLPGGASLPVRIIGVAAFLAVLAVVLRGRGARDGTRDAAGPPAAGFGRGYWIVVAGEVAALAAGLAVLNLVFHTPRAGVAWVSVVVGAHFVALAMVSGLRFFHVLGAAITLCGVIGLVLV